MTAGLHTDVRCPMCGTKVLSDLLELIGEYTEAKANVRGCCEKCGLEFNMWVTVPVGGLVIREREED